jgi:glyoxylase-like metal-dependent hydrolase (beta-lactamase superfamily II)
MAAQNNVSLHAELIVTGDLQENCYLLWQEGSADAIVFDPGDEAEKISRSLKKKGLSIAAFLQTHCHYDHIGALGALKAQAPNAPIYIPREEAEWLERPTLNLSYFTGAKMTAPKPDHLIDDGMKIVAAGLSLTAIHVPGHSPGGMAFWVENATGSASYGHLFCGDILFAGGIGRTDLPGGAGEDVLVEGIREKLFCLPDTTIVHPGHGPETTIGREKRSNPFCGMVV